MPESPADPTRRALLAGAAALAAIPALPAFAAAPGGPGPVGPAAVEIHLVDGWVLTSGDLRALGFDAR